MRTARRRCFTSRSCSSVLGGLADMTVWGQCGRSVAGRFVRCCQRRPRAGFGSALARVYPVAMAQDSRTVSQRIRDRLREKQQRFHANDNISAFIQPGELEELTREVAAKMSGVLESLVIDVEHDHNT